MSAPRSRRCRAWAVGLMSAGAIVAGVPGCSDSGSAGTSVLGNSSPDVTASSGSDLTGTPAPESTGGGSDGGVLSGPENGGSGGGPDLGSHYTGNFLSPATSGDTAEMTLVAPDTGGVATDVTTVGVTAGGSEYTVVDDGCSGTSVASGNSCPFSVRYEAQDGGTHDGTLTIGLVLRCVSTGPEVCRVSGASAAHPVTLTGEKTISLTSQDPSGGSSPPSTGPADQSPASG